MLRERHDAGDDGDTIHLMLERLVVRGLAIIDQVELELEPGFAALTGETGAGKSLLVESLKLLSGQRAQTDLVRTGDDRLAVEGWFLPDATGEVCGVLDEIGIAATDELVLRREVTAAGRSRCWVNDTSVTAGALQRIAPHLLSIHGQHEQHGLAEGAVQRDLVDQFGGLADLVDLVAAAYGVWADAAAAVTRLREAQSRRRDRLDTIGVQIAEIDAADPQQDEDQELLARRQLLRHAVRVLELSQSALSRLADEEGAAVDALARAARDVEGMVACGLPLDAAAGRLAEAQLHVEEVVREVRALVDGVEEDPSELERVESRLHRIEQLMLKYGSPIEEVLRHRDRLAAERDELRQVEERLEVAEAAAEGSLREFDRVAAELDAAREIAGRELVAEVEDVLHGLNMGGTRLEFEWRSRPDQRSPLSRGGQTVAFDATGVNECQLLIAANPGEEARPMARVASGGELSRLHLALRAVLIGRHGDRSRTLLFDEVDSGLGGATAAALADVLARLAAESQVLVVTHLPQVAARADRHYRVEKVVEHGRALTRTRRLDPAERETELARMLAGEQVTESALQHARQLLTER
jgi:DNA repair protein RecN (Recombination protein N)